jgi:hypothetical protein
MTKLLRQANVIAKCENEPFRARESYAQKQLKQALREPQQLYASRHESKTNSMSQVPTAKVFKIKEPAEKILSSTPKHA